MLTRSGITVAVGALVLLTAGWAADYPELVALAFAGVLTLFAAALWMLARPDLTTVRDIPHRVAVGDKSAIGALTVTNMARRRSPRITATETVTATSEVARAIRISIPIPSLGPGESCQVHYPLPAQRRDIYRIGPLDMSHTDPLG